MISLSINTSIHFYDKYSPTSEFVLLVYFSNDESHAKFPTWNFHIQRQGQLLLTIFDHGLPITMPKEFCQIILGTRLNQNSLRQYLKSSPPVSCYEAEVIVMSYLDEITLVKFKTINSLVKYFVLWKCMVI